MIDEKTVTPTPKSVRMTSERDIAIAVLLELSTGRNRFSLLGFYDDDADMISAIAERLGLEARKEFTNKLKKVVRVLVNYGVLARQRVSTHKEYFGEPTQQTEYILEAGRAHRMQGENKHYNSPEWEAAFILRRAYPDPASDNLMGKVVKYKSQPTGVKDKPRFPVFLGFRDKVDM